jgi:RimJ/RimL family protein N-acetyltransferase
MKRPTRASGLAPTWLVGAKVRLRAIEPEDVPMLLPGTPTFVIQTKSGEDIGVTGLTLLGARAELGIALHETRFWNGGYGTDAVRTLVDGAFRALPLQRIELFVYPDNARAIRCYEKAGFAREGVLRSREYRRGQYDDVVIMSVLHEEWERTRAAHD